MVHTNCEVLTKGLVSKKKIELCFESLLDHLDTKSLQQLVVCWFLFLFFVVFKGMLIANQFVNVTHHTASKV